MTTPVNTRDLSDRFFADFKAMCERLGLRGEDLLHVMYVESGIDPAKAHPSGAAVGLNQLSTTGKPSVLESMGWTADPRGYLTLTAEEQLPYVERFFKGKPYLKGASAALLYADNWLPAAAQDAVKQGRSTDASYVLASETGDRWGSSTRSGVTRPNEQWYYLDNKGLDVTQDGETTLGDLHTYLERVKGKPRLVEAQARLRALGPSSVGPGAAPSLKIPAGLGVAFAKVTATGLGAVLGYAVLRTILHLREPS